MTQPLALWTAATPNGWKVSIMIEELLELWIALPSIEVINVDIMNGEQFSDAFSAVSANQKIPGLVHGDIRLMESCAILQYLGEQFPSSLYPSGAVRYEVLQWLTWQAAGLGPTFGNKLSYTRYMADVPEEQKVHPLTRFNAEAQRLLRVLDKQLEGKRFVCGEDFTIADIAIFPWIRGYKWSKIDVTLHPNVLAWKERVHQRPGVKRGLAYGAKSGEEEQWSEETKRKYALGGSFMASNQTIAESHSEV
ncbi:MAG: glutathione S-transferase [Gammaproteobacteria bacterium]|nr:glutathione S-transferase [Gammaproteobacteria bacterium]